MVLMMMMVIPYFLAWKTIQEEEDHCTCGVQMLPCLLTSGCQNAEQKRVAVKSSMGLLQRPRHAKLLSPPRKQQPSPPELLCPSTHQCWGWRLPREGSKPEWAQGAHPGLGNTQPAPTPLLRQCHELMGAWPPFPGAGQLGTTAQTSRKFSCFIMEGCCLRGVLKDYQPWVDLPNVQPDLAVTSEFEESKARMINKECLMINKECSEYRMFFYSSWIFFLFQLDIILYSIN